MLREMADSQIRVRRRVCVIGAGAAGLCAIRHIASDLQSFEPAVFEQSNDVGGTWIYDDRTGLDENGYPIHSSMYKNLRTNLPMRLMNFPDYVTMGLDSEAICCGSHEQVHSYLEDYANHFNIQQFIQFSTRVEYVRPVENEDWKQTTWKVGLKNLNTQITDEKEFDTIFVCNGHYFEPSIPVIPGIEAFPGDVLHSHDYRKPEKYAGKRVVVLGAGPSGFDIAVELSGYASQVYLSHNHERLIGPLPSNMTQVAGVDRMNDQKFVLRDGSIVMADTFIYCTGYKYSFPFLNDSCGIRVDRHYVSPLYKHLINVQNPSMCIIGIPTQVIPFSFFHIQIQYYLNVLKGQATLPTREEMFEDSRLKDANRSAHVLGMRQFDYEDDLAWIGRFEPLPAYFKNGYSAWKSSKVGNLLNYKNSRCVVASDNIKVEIITQSGQVFSATESNDKNVVIYFC